ncbi:DUF4328 domain-containing protein [Streptomyces sp. NPDC057705]|uniref:DUF4328 domain-containing protein n=1 Tax=Streptomyces sp. NPDC057705 TaxID=3346222 RepID=UPI003681B968
MSATSRLKPRPSLPARTPQVPRLLSAAVVVLLAAVILTDLFSLYAGTRAYYLLDWEGGFAYASMEDWEAADILYRRAGMFQGQAVIVCGIVFIAWFHRMYCSAVALAPDRLRIGTGWAIGAWLFPVVNLWRPFRIALDMWGACVPAPAQAQAQAQAQTQDQAPGQPAKAAFWPVGLWWGLFTVSGAFTQYTAWMYGRAEAFPDLREATVLLLAADVLDIVPRARAPGAVDRAGGGQGRRPGCRPAPSEARIDSGAILPSSTSRWRTAMTTTAVARMTTPPSCRIAS